MGFLDKWTEEDRVPDSERERFSSKVPVRNFVGNRIPMSTTDSLPGVGELTFVCLVTSMAALDASLSTRKWNELDLRAQLVKDALEQLAESAINQGANAVTGVTLTWAAGSVGGLTIGTAAGRGDSISLIAMGNAVTVQAR